MFGKICSWSFCSSVIYVISTIIMLFFARCLYDVSQLSPAFSPQWYQELWWWSRWMFFWFINVPAVPLHYLEHKHSEIKVMEFFPENDADAFKKFLYHAGHPDFDDTVVIMRNVWANYTDNKLQHFNTIQHFRENCDLEQEFKAFACPYRNVPSGFADKLGVILDRLDDHVTGEGDLVGLAFDYEIVTKNEAVYEAYRDLWDNLDEGLAERMASVDKKRGGSALFHGFLYYGNALVTSLHAAFIPDYFIQIANSKKWHFIHKAYFPYLGLIRHFKPGRAATNMYYAEDYPDQVIPYTEVVLNPGDLMYFSSWHPHEVFNVHPDRLGFAVGARPVIRNMLVEPFRPLWFYNMNTFLPLIAVNAYKKIFLGKTGSRTPTKKIRECAGALPAYNGTHQARFDFKMIDGKCDFRETDRNYQAKELLGEWSPKQPHWISGHDSFFDISHINLSE